MAGTIWPQASAILRARFCLNGVRPRWPEQYLAQVECAGHGADVSMESGLDGRNNGSGGVGSGARSASVSMESGLDGRNNELVSYSNLFSNGRLNGVRPRWPEQSCRACGCRVAVLVRLNGVRPRWPEQSCRACGCRVAVLVRLNGVRPRWPEQCAAGSKRPTPPPWSQWSPA